MYSSIWNKKLHCAFTGTPPTPSQSQPGQSTTAGGPPPGPSETTPQPGKAY